MRYINYWAPTLAWMAFIFFLSSQRHVQVSDIFAVQFIFFKTLHVIEYAILYTLFYRSLRNASGQEAWQYGYNAWLYSIIFAMTDEIHQLFVPTREGTIRDVVIDAAGITLIALYIWKLLPKAPRRLKHWAKKLQLI